MKYIMRFLSAALALLGLWNSLMFVTYFIWMMQGIAIHVPAPETASGIKPGTPALWGYLRMMFLSGASLALAFKLWHHPSVNNVSWQAITPIAVGGSLFIGGALPLSYGYHDTRTMLLLSGITLVGMLLLSIGLLFARGSRSC
jgi:hypothetical protein